MIPVKLYKDKLSELDNVLMEMGKDPNSVSEWLLGAMRDGHIKMSAIREKGAQSVALVKSLPKTDTQSILGLKLTDDQQMRKALKTLSANEQTLYEEINDIERIQKMLRRLHGKTAFRLDAVKDAVFSLRNDAADGGQKAAEARQRAEELESQVVPVLARLRTELLNAIKFCNGEIRLRHEKILRVNRKQLSVPKYNRRARRKRLRRAAAKDPNKKAFLDNEADDTDGGGGDGD